MRVCVVCESHLLTQMGGAEYQAHVLAEELAARPGVEVTYLARRAPAATPAGYPYPIRLIGSDKGIRRRAVFFDAGGLRRALEELRPDVIYEQMRQSYAAVCADHAKRHGIPFFVHIASEWDLDPSLFPLRLSPNTPFDMVEAALGSRGLRRASHVIVQTEAQGRKLKERWGIDAALLVRNFQALPEELPPRPAGPASVLWVGNIKEVKRPELYVKLAQSFRDRADVHFHMVGRPWNHWRAEPLMREIAATPNLTYHGEQPIAKVNELMARASFYVNTSSHEGFPNTYIQAWAHGAVLFSLCVDPYVGPPHGGVDAMGIGFITGTLERMHDRIVSLLDDPAERDRIALASFQFARANHSLAEGARLADAMLTAASRAKAS